MKLRYVCALLVLAIACVWAVLAWLYDEDVVRGAVIGGLIGLGAACTTFLVYKLGLTRQEW
jgi:hypothetical protein